MRQGFGGNIIYNAKNEFAGVNLGADYCAEHEWGIRRMTRMLGITEDERVMGAERRRVTKSKSVDGGTVTIKKKNYYYIYCADVRYLEYKGMPSVQKVYDSLGMHFSKSTLEQYGFLAFWGEGGFQLLFAEEHASEGEKLLQSIREGDALVYVGGGNGPFGNGGLKVVILSKLDENTIREMRERDEDKYLLARKATETGIYDILREAGKRYFALIPRWGNEEKTEIIFWLNPMEQDKNASGWFSIDDLKKWAEGKGPIIKRGRRHG